MTSGRRHFERALGALLSLDILEVDERVREFPNSWLRAQEHLRAAEMVGELDQRGGRDDLHFRARPGSLRPASCGTDETFAARIGANGGREHAGDCGNGAVKAKLAQNGEAGQRVGGDGADGGHQAERNGKIIMAAFLGKVGGREIDRDAAGGERKPGGNERRAHPLARLGHGLVWKADDMECGQAGRHLDLDIDRAGFDTLERYRCDPLDHVSQTVPALPRGLDTNASANNLQEQLGNRITTARSSVQLAAFLHGSDCLKIETWRNTRKRCNFTNWK